MKSKTLRQQDSWSPKSCDVGDNLLKEIANLRRIFLFTNRDVQNINFTQR